MVKIAQTKTKTEVKIPVTSAEQKIAFAKERKRRIKELEERDTG